MTGTDSFNRPTTFVTVVFEGDELMLRLQARSIARYARALPGARIIVIENFRSPRTVGWREQQRALRRPCAERALHRCPRSGVNAKYDGWWKQQVLKLVIARHVETDTYRSRWQAEDGAVGLRRPSARMVL
jgi:hypothetical protein